MDLCRRVIRQQLNKERIEQGKINDLNLPKTIKDYLAYKDRRTNQLPLCTVTENGIADADAAEDQGSNSSNGVASIEMASPASPTPAAS